MPPLPAHLLLLLLLVAPSASAASFTCIKPGTCQSAVIGYDVPYDTTYEELISRFSPITLRDLVAANQLLPDTATKQAVPVKTTLTIPFRCRCTGNGVGQSNLYTVQNKFEHGLLTYQPEIVSANHIADANDRRKLWIPLPCSCDKVDDAEVTHFAYVVPNGENTLEIAAKYGVSESALLKFNNITNHTTLRQGQILDIPLQGMVQGDLSSMGTWSRVHYISRYRNRRLLGRVVKGNKQGIKGPSGAFAAILLCIYFMTWYYWRSAHKSLSSGKNGGMQFDYTDLACATDRFSKKSMIAEGHYGAVYKATISGREVAVKKLKAEGKTKEFHHELLTISKTRHTNLVMLEGWCGKIRKIDVMSCWKRAISVELFLVFEWIPNGTLGRHLRNKEQVLTWERRYQIVKGIGSALRYLHHECNPSILHRDIKPDNILLDDDFNAKLADFGLSMTTSQNGVTVYTAAVGSMEYMDPQYKKHGTFQFNHKFDVYSFGLVLLEIACTGKSRETVCQMHGGSAQKVQVDGVADDRLRVFDHTEMERVVFLGLMCSQSEETQRPSMEDAMKFLEDGIELPATIEGGGGYNASCTVNEEAAIMPHGTVSSC